MSTLSPNLVMVLPVGTDLVDIDQLVSDLSKLDTEIGHYVCTSITRPSTHYVGMKIFETDSKATYVWDGTTWNYIGGGLICKTGRAANLATLTATWTRIYWTTDYIAANIAAARPSLWSITAPMAGTYSIEAAIMWSDSAQVAAGGRTVIIKKNSLGNINTGVTVRQVNGVPTTAGFNNMVFLSCILKLVAGDDIDVWTYQSSGVNQDVVSSEAYTFFQMRLVG